MPYQFLDDIATADVAFKAWGESPEDLFTSCSDALMNVMVENLEAISRKEKKEIRVEHDALDMLLFNFLQEFIFYKDAELLLLRAAQIRIAQKNPQAKYQLTAELSGERIDTDRHHFNVDVKAVTLHRFEVKQGPMGWEASVVLDI